MKLAVKFSPPAEVGGSQRTLADNLINALHLCAEELVVYSSFPQFRAIAGLQVRPYRSPAERETITGKLSSWVHDQFRFERKLREDACHILFCPFTYEALRRMTSVPQVITVHDLIPLRHPEDFPKTYRLWKYVHIPAIRNAHGLIAVSESTKRDLVRILRVPDHKISVVPNGYNPVSQGEMDTQERPKRPYILYVSSSHYPYKNIPRLLDSFKRLTPRYAHCLVIVGDKNRFTPRVEHAIERLGLCGVVTLLSGLSQHQLSHLYRQADLFVYPTMEEGFGMPPLEAMSCGTPVVASNVSAVPEVCGDAVYYTDPYSTEDMASAMDRVLSSPGLRQELVARGFERTRLFSWDRTAQQVVDVCANVAGR